MRLMWAVLGQPDSIGVEDEDAVIAERDFLGLPGGIVAVVGSCLWKLISSASAGNGIGGQTLCVSESPSGWGSCIWTSDAFLWRVLADSPVPISLSSFIVRK